MFWRITRHSEYIIPESRHCFSWVFSIHALFTGKFRDDAKPLPDPARRAILLPEFVFHFNGSPSFVRKWRKSWLAWGSSGKRVIFVPRKRFLHKSWGCVLTEILGMRSSFEYSISDPKIYLDLLETDPWEAQYSPDSLVWRGNLSDQGPTTRGMNFLYALTCMAYLEFARRRSEAWFVHSLTCLLAVLASFLYRIM